MTHPAQFRFPRRQATELLSKPNRNPRLAVARTPPRLGGETLKQRSHRTPNSTAHPPPVAGDARILGLARLRHFRLRTYLTVFALAAVGLFTMSDSASAALFGHNHLTYGQCCSGVRLDGTRANISVSSISPDASHCIAFQSIVTSLDSARQLQTAVAKCGPNANIGGTCSLSNNFVKLVERIPAVGSPVCYPHGAAALNSGALLTVDNPSGDGIWYTFINGTRYEGQSGYTNQIHISEGGEYTGSSCASWSTGSSYVAWQRYNFPSNAWTTVQSSGKNNDGCWFVGLVNNGNFLVSR